MVIKLSILLLCSLNVFTAVLSAKILAVFPFPSISHQVVFRPLTQELAKRGHEVTIITTDPAFPKGGAPANLKEIDIHDISYQVWRKLLESYSGRTSTINFSTVRKAANLFIYILQMELQSPELQKLISDKSNKFDLILIEAAMRPALAFSYVFKAPVILLSSLGMVFTHDHIVGAPSHPLLYPSSLTQKINNLTIFEKISEIYTHYSVEYANYLNEEDENVALKQMFGPDVPPLSELYNNVHMLFMNIHPIWADNRPVPPNVIYMNGIHQIPEKDLPKDLKTYLDSSKNGVIYLSFGTNVLSRMIPQDKIEIFVKVLSELPYDVLWKWDKDELPGKGDNIKISHWYPQSDLLRHPKVKLFITQAGLQSTDEAITAEVPLVAIPMLGDQWYNAEKYVKYGIGKNLDIKSVTKTEFKAAIETVINDDSYRKNIKKLRELLRDQPEPPLQRVVWWTEYVIRHGGVEQLRSPAANMSYAQYYEIKTVLLVLTGVFALKIVLSLVLFYVYNKFIKSMLASKKKQKVN